MKNSKKIILMLLVFGMAAAGIFAAAALFQSASPAADPTGASYVAVTGEETIGNIAVLAGKALVGSNFVWIMICGFLVFFFQCGFAMVETGFCRAKNAVHTMTMNFMVFLVGAIGYFIMGFALQMGGSGGAISLGTGGSALNALVSVPGLGGIFGFKGFGLIGTYDAGIYALFFFQMVFMDTTVTIPTGSMAERVKYSAMVITSFFISMFLYPLFANWVWGGGFLSTLGKTFAIGHGVVDFAGSAVVHTMGGMIALSGAIVIGPRIGKFKKDGTARAFPGHNLPMAIIGTIILFFCWFAFNAGSTLSASDFRLSVVATNTMIAGAAGGLVAMSFMWLKYGKPDPSMTANGALAGLVAITASCAFVNGLSSLIIGIVAGILVCLAVPFVENKLKLDDPVGAISVHCVNGLWGVLATGLFADGTYGDGTERSCRRCPRACSTGMPHSFWRSSLPSWSFLYGDSAYPMSFSESWIRSGDCVVAPEDELEGLDVPEMGVLAYPDSPITRSELDFDQADNAPIRQLARFAGYLPGGGQASSVLPKTQVSIDRAVPVELLSAPAVPYGVGCENVQNRYHYKTEPVRGAERGDERYRNHRHDCDAGAWLRCPEGKN